VGADVELSDIVSPADQDVRFVRGLREFQDKTPGNLCGAELTNAQQDSLKKIGKNLTSQVVFQYL